MVSLFSVVGAIVVDGFGSFWVGYDPECGVFTGCGILPGDSAGT